MAYYYVKSGGTATGDGGRYASQQTGSFAGLGASGYYSSIYECTNTATTDPVDGDFICVSDAHAASAYSSNEALLTNSADNNGVVTIISVSDTAIDTYSPGASESTTTGDIILNGDASIYGVSFYVHDDFITGTNGANVEFTDLTLSADGNSDVCLSVANAHNVYLKNVVFDPQTAAQSPITIGTTFNLEMINCSFGGTATVTSLFFGANGANIYMYGCDWSAAAISEFFPSSTFDNANDEPLIFHCDKTKVHASTSVVPSSLPIGRHIRYLVTRSGSSDADAEYQYYYASMQCYVQDETSIYRDGATAFPSGQKISLKCVTHATDVSRSYPFSFIFPTRYTALSSTSTDNITIYFMSSSTLNNGDVWAEVIYDDGTTKINANIKESVTNSYDPFRTAGSLTTNTESWTGMSSPMENRYQIDLDTSSDAGADCVPIIRVYVAKASTTIYFCPTLGLS